MRRSVHPTKNSLRQVRHKSVRARVTGSDVTPRISVFRGNRVMVVQLIDDSKGKVLCYVTTRELKATPVEGKSTKVALAFLAGKTLAEKATVLKIKTVVFDRGGYKYHGRVAAVAEGARAGGLQF